MTEDNFRMPSKPGESLNVVLSLGAKDAHYSHDGTCYMSLGAFPGVLFDWDGYLIFQCEDEYRYHPRLKHKPGEDRRCRTTIRHGGISKLPGYQKFKNSQTAEDILRADEERWRAVN